MENLPQLEFSLYNMDMFRKTLIHMHNTGSSDAYIRRSSKIFFKKNGIVYDVSKGIVVGAEFDDVVSQLTNAAVVTIIKSAKPYGKGWTVKKAQLDDGSVSNLRYRIQIASTAARESMVMVIREIPIIPPDPSELGIDDGIIGVQLEFRHGVGFVCGATNSGKSTSIASLIKAMLEQVPRHIMTLEEPREFVFDSIMNPLGIIEQMEIPFDVLSYSDGIVNNLRMSPDCVFVGEVRDYQTSNALLQLAETGHNVITTLHVARGHLLFQRIASFYEGAQRESVVAKAIDQTNFILVQKLIPKIGGGRVAVREFLILDADMKRNLQEVKVLEVSSKLYKLFEEYGVTMQSDALDLYNNKVINKLEHNKLCRAIGEIKHVL